MSIGSGNRGRCAGPIIVNILLLFLFHFFIFIIRGLATFWISMTAGIILYLLIESDIPTNKTLKSTTQL
ncbi:MAG: hypothetical protein ACJA1Z_002128 [Patiriisocius sp.]|jgi:hypothetical protein